MKRDEKRAGDDEMVKKQDRAAPAAKGKKKEHSKLRKLPSGLTHTAFREIR